MINHEKKIYLNFLLVIDRSWLSIRQASWTRFTIDHSKIQNECNFFISDGIFSLLVHNPSAASAITMPANGLSVLGRSSVHVLRCDRATPCLYDDSGQVDEIAGIRGNILEYDKHRLSISGTNSLPLVCFRGYGIYPHLSITILRFAFFRAR